VDEEANIQALTESFETRAKKISEVLQTVVALPQQHRLFTRSATVLSDVDEEKKTFSP